MSDSLKDFAGFAGDATNEAIRKSSQNVETLSQAGLALSRGLQEISREWMNWAAASIEKSRDGMLELAQCRSPQGLMEIQNRLVGENVELLIGAAQRITEIATHLSWKTPNNAAAAQQN